MILVLGLQQKEIACEIIRELAKKGDIVDDHIFEIIVSCVTKVMIANNEKILTQLRAHGLCI